ncbi:MAG: LysR family transcriptional regulator [Brevundimonas sp.]|uniref:LysR family transcriptional regulator n=1 Tax=Brevundimonas albigilva TaxID=1312364 RepID=A0ABY4SNU5_9CAUL|nr:MULTISPECIES: LysR family transcriptional regulator [Brevundimonas]PZU62159.1 MAG: LysR family transcriptional regulator [Brevundimonas sp.]UQV17644.1 LysR family transcriptional regulator [Brevundimonas albigilva]URI14493.1 LysR family transcriptional regulator [Brevundimonas albigilva]
MRPDRFGDLAVFAAIAADRSFTRAARRLGVTQSALSQTMKRLEGQLGFSLLSRTTRSVAPTAAGERLLATLAPALAGLDDEIEILSQTRGTAIGTVRITTGKHAADTVLWPMLPAFMRRHPGIEVEVCVEDAMTDIVAGRYDAGVRLGERLEKDMIALPIGPSLRIAVVASPAYLADHPAPMKPADLTTHRCIAYGDSQGYLSPWSFERNGHAVTVTPGRGPVFNDGDLLAAAALEGFGVLYILEDLVAAPIADGRLIRLLEPWCEPFAGYHLYYPDRRGTRAFELLKESLKAGRVA